MIGFLQYDLAMTKINIKTINTKGITVEKNEKSYSEYLNEITQDELFEGLLGHGLFTERIPNFLTSEKFYEFCKEEGTKCQDDNPYRYITYEAIRDIGTPRYLSIPNPFAYYKQCEILCRNWDKLKEHFKNKTKEDTHKISRIHIRKLYDRADPNDKKLIHNNYDDLEETTLVKKNIFEMNYKNRDDSNIGKKIRIGNKYQVKADISNCFPSIYTHSIPWAMLGKEEAKQLKNDKKEIPNQIDEHTNKMKYNETTGIFIGPHSSNLVSEIILVAVDSDLRSLKPYKYIRHIDDYTCYLDSKDEAEEFILNLSKCLKKYDLALNHKKTKISELPLMFEEEWINRLKLFQMDTYEEQIKYPSVVAFLDMAIALMKKNDNKASILNYAIKRLLKKKMTNNAQNCYFDALHHLVLLYPYLIPLIEKVFDDPTKQISKEKITEIAKDIYEMGKKTNNCEARSYAIYFYLKYDLYEFSEGEDFHESILDSNDCILMLLGYLKAKHASEDTCIKKYIKKAESMITTKPKKKKTNVKSLDDEFWLFTYEVLRIENKTLQGTNWQTLAGKNISFIKEEFLKEIKV